MLFTIKTILFLYSDGSSFSGLEIDCLSWDKKLYSSENHNIMALGMGGGNLFDFGEKIQRESFLSESK